MRARLSIGALALVLASCATGGQEEANRGSDTTVSTTSVSEDPGAVFGQPSVPARLESIAEVWGTDFTKTVIDLDELLVGIPGPDPRDRIPPIDEPSFGSVAEIDWLEDQEPGVLIEIDDDARFYPLAVLTRHEIVNDEVGGVPLAVTYCPLCNTAVAFDRRFEGETLRLGVSGLLRNSDLVMWDLQTETLWQQVTGEAIVGLHAGKKLTPVGSAIVRWADFELNHPDGLALTNEQGFGSIYGSNPYQYYSSGARPYAFFQGEIDDRYPALSRVVGVSVAEGDKAYPFSEISVTKAVNDFIGGRPVVVFWGAADTTDALDGPDISRARAIGTGIAFDPVVDGRLLTFESIGDTEFVDNETGTTWTILGKAVAGELEGAELELIPHRNEFWFAWQAFYPESLVWDG